MSNTQINNERSWLPGEVWLPIKEFPGYLVSSLGRVRHDNYFMKLKIDKYGYCTTSLHKDGKRYYFFVHRLVATAFIANPSGKSEINHKNGIKTDNRIENLEWVTDKENKRHAIDNGLIYGLTEKRKEKIKKLTESGKYSQTKIAEMCKVSQSTVSRIANNSR